MADQAFRLTKTIDGATFYYDGPGATWQVSYGTPASAYYPGSNWEKIPASDIFISRETLDLAGLSSEERTLFFGTQILQRAAQYLSTVIVDAVAGGAVVSDVMIVTDVPLANPMTIVSGGVNAMNAGFNNSADDYTNVKLARGVIMSQTTTAPISMVNSDSWEFGSSDPTAADQLFLYRYVSISATAPAPSDGITVPAIRYVASGISAVEDSTVYINRLRRSYEQQQQI